MTPANAMNDALGLHQAGRAEEAEAIYRRILAVNPNDAPALHMLGVLLSQSGRQQDAIVHIRRAIELQPHAAEYYLNLALIYLKAGDGANAATLARGALAVSPGNYRALNHLGNALKLMGQIGESLECFAQSLKSNPEFVAAMRNLADSFRRLGRDAEADHWLAEALRRKPDDLEAIGAHGEELLQKKKFAEAADVFRKLIAAHPNHWGGYNGLGVATFSLGQTAGAVPLFEKAVALAPNLAGPHNSLGHAYTLLHRLDEAIASLRTSLRLDPKSADALNNFSYAYFLEGRTDEAIELLHQAIAQEPAAPESYSNLGNVHLARLELDGALRNYDRALYLRPDHAEAHWNKAMLLLLSGDFARGWIEHEWRWTKFVEYRRNFRKPLWIGGDIAAKTILLHGEQGFGDSIQFSRYATDVARRGAKVVLECPPALVPLLRTIEGVSEAVARDRPLPEFDVHCPLMSLPYALGIDSPEKIPGAAGYLQAPDDVREAWAKEMGPFEKDIKVGIAWAGAPKHSRDFERSIPPAALARLASVEGVRFFSLQRPRDGQELAGPPGLDLVDFTARFNDFAETAGLVSQLDLVIAVDTSMAHLAGALGKPVWTMITYQPDWRWLLVRSDSPWYPSMRLFRQPAARNWECVIGDVVKELKVFVGARRG